MKLLVVAAWEPELERFRARCADAAPGGVTLVVEPLGVGVVEGAIAMTRSVVRHEPTAALLLGTCGVFPDRAGMVAVGSVVAGASVRIVDAAVAGRTAELPAPMPLSATFDPGLRDTLVAAGARSVQIANTVGITVDDQLAASLAREADADVEHLEAFAFARACAAASLPCAAVLGVANVVGAAGRAQWLAGHASASAKAADVAFDALAPILALLRVRTSTTAR